MCYRIFKNSFYTATVFVLIGFAKYSSANDLLLYDILITNGRVVDGTGYPWFFADIAV